MTAVKNDPVLHEVLVPQQAQPGRALHEAGRPNGLAPERPPGVRIAIVEDHALLAQSLGFTLEAAGLEVLVPALGDRSGLLETLHAFAPSLVLLDLELGEPLGDGTRLIGPLTALGAHVLVMTSVSDRIRLAATLEAGAVGFLAKTEPVDVLIETVRRAARGECVHDLTERHDLLFDLRRHRREEQVRDRAFARLTPREREALVALAEGKTVACLAEEWVVAQTTVRTQVRGILTKFGVGSQLEAVALARRCGWLEDPAAHC